MLFDKTEEDERGKEDERREGDKREEEVAREIVKKFDAMLNDIKNDGKTKKSLIIRTGDNINSLQPLIIKLLNARKTVLEKLYGFHKEFNIFDDIDNSYKLQMHNPRTSTMIDRKDEMLEYLEIIRLRLIDMLYTPSLNKKINKQC